MRSGHYPSQDKHRIKTTTDGLYYAADIPHTAWGPLLTELPRFKLIPMGDTSVSPQTQTAWFSRMREGEFFSKPYLILMSSDVDDDMSTAQGYDLMKRALTTTRIQITESSRIGSEECHEETVFMLTNVYDEAPDARVQEVRDWCKRHQDCFRLVCAAGDPAAIARRLKIKFNAVFYMDSKVSVEQDFS